MPYRESMLKTLTGYFKHNLKYTHFIWKEIYHAYYTGISGAWDGKYFVLNVLLFYFCFCGYVKCVWCNDIKS